MRFNFPRWPNTPREAQKREARQNKFLQDVDSGMTQFRLGVTSSVCPKSNSTAAELSLKLKKKCDCWQVNHFA